MKHVKTAIKLQQMAAQATARSKQAGLALTSTQQSDLHALLIVEMDIQLELRPAMMGQVGLLFAMQIALGIKLGIHVQKHQI